MNFTYGKLQNHFYGIAIKSSDESHDSKRLGWTVSCYAKQLDPGLWLPYNQRRQGRRMTRWHRRGGRLKSGNLTVIIRCRRPVQAYGTSARRNRAECRRIKSLGRLKLL